MLKKLVSNSISNVSVLVLKIIITFVMSPIIVSSLGNYDYGIWEIVFSVVGYMGLLDIGIPTAIVRYTAKYNAENDREKLNKLYSSALVFMGCTGFVLCLTFIFWTIIAPDSFLQENEVSNKYTWFLLIIGFQLLFTFPGYVFQSIHQGLQRYGILNIITVNNSIVGAVIIYYILHNGGGLIALALANGLGISIKFLTYWVLLLLPKYGSFRFRVKNVSWESIKELFSFGVNSLIIGVSIQIALSTGPFVIGAFLGPAIVTFYVIPTGLVRHAMNIIASLTLSFLPTFSDLNAKKEYIKISELYLNASKVIVGLVVPIIIGICFLGEQFIARWMGQEYAENGKIIIYIITFAYLLPYLNPFSNRFLTGIGRQEILAKLRFISALLNLFMSLVLVRFYNKEGVALAALIPALIVEPFILYSVCRQLRITVLKYLNSVFVPLVVPAIIIIAFLWYTVMAYNLTTYKGIAVITFCTVMLYAPAFYLFSLNKNERLYLVNKLKIVLNFRR